MTTFKIVISDEEYRKIIEKLKFYDATRNTLLTVSFTAVLTILGLAISTEADTVPPWIFLIPFFLIIPFSARISYYRLASARANSFLKMFAPERALFERGGIIVPESHGHAYPIMAWLVNHEMVLLGLATGATFLMKSVDLTHVFGPREYIEILIPILLVSAVFFISNSTYSYKRLSENYDAKWKRYYDDLSGQMVVNHRV